MKQRGIFIAATHWVSFQQKGKKEEIWSFAETVRLVNGRYQSLDAIPKVYGRTTALQWENLPT